MKRAAAWASLCAMFIVLAELLFVAKHIAHPGGDELLMGASSRSSDATALPTNTEVARVLKDTGANLPPVGRSLFDRLVMNKTASGGLDIPFPFPKLLSALSVRAGCGNKDSGCYQTVLIPLGRSLQRTAAAPEFFKYPRIVVAFNMDPSQLTNDFFPLLKDRLYLGYQEQANLIEVISYNEEAGRFEFQLVKDYARDTVPRVFYGNRAVCVSCHQNHAPIFSRQVWDETNANPEIARRLKAARDDFLGFPITVGVDVPNAIDDATDRANLLAAYQSLWRDGCGKHIPDVRMCRAQALRASLQYRLTGERSFDQRSPAFTHGFLAPLRENWQLHWPDGIRIPNNDIPNRDPLQFADSERLAHVPARFEPLLPRDHKEIWQFETDRYRLIKGIGEFFSDVDIRLLSEKLQLSGKRDGAEQNNFVSPGFVALDNGIERMLDESAGQAALDEPTIQREPLLRALLHALDVTDVDRCCRQNSALSPALMDDDHTIKPASPSADLAPFYAYCARCHATKEPFPPNFMQGSTARVEGELKRCADRIVFRLAMWDVAPEQRPKTPMPPATGLTLQDGRWTASAAIASMRTYLAPLVHNDLRQAPEKLVSRSYEALPSCTSH